MLVGRGCDAPADGARSLTELEGSAAESTRRPRAPHSRSQSGRRASGTVHVGLIEGVFRVQWGKRA